MIEVKHLTKRYGSYVAVEDLSFRVEEGHIYGLLGPNGAGKSTTMNILTGYLSPTSGTVVIDGHDILEEPEAAKACIGYLPEQPPLYPEMTVSEYLLFAAELKKVKKPERQAQVTRVVRRAGLAKVEGRLIRNLSKGYRQRVGIAQALLGAPKLIILDEPTVGLDPAQVIEVRRLIRELGKTHTVILSSHILSEVQSVCDQVLIIAHGRLVAKGAPDQLGKKAHSDSVLQITALGKWQPIQKAVASLEGVEAVTCEREQNGEVSFSVKCRNGERMRAEVSRTLAKAGGTVLAMSIEAANLEETFLALTETPEEDTDSEEAQMPAKHPFSWLRRPDHGDTEAADGEAEIAEDAEDAEDSEGTAAGEDAPLVDSEADAEDFEDAADDLEEAEPDEVLKAGQDAENVDEIEDVSDKQNTGKEG